MARLKRGEGTVSMYTLADGTQRWRARWWEDGKQRSATRPTRDEALELLIDSSADRRLGRSASYSTFTVRQCVERHLRKRQGKLSPNTLTEYRRIAARHIYPHIGAMRVKTLTPGAIQNWLDDLTEKKRGRGEGAISVGLVKNARSLLNRAISDMVRLEELPRNPVIGTSVATGRHSKRVVWSDDDVTSVLKIAPTIDRQLEVFYRVALTTGMRSGEIRALKWADIDFKAGVITCRRTMTRIDGREVVGETTKTDRAREISIPKTTLDALKSRRAAQAEARLASIPGHWANTDLVFDRGNGAPLLQVSLREQHIRACKKAEVQICRLHDLRHYAATALLRRGISAKVVADLLGHSRINVTLDVYSHVDLDMQRTATDILGEIAK